MDNSLAHIGLSSEADIIRRVLEGETALFEILIRRHNPVLYKIARSNGFNHADAQDLMQDTHVAAFQQLAQFGHRAAYKTWISKIMVNKCLYKLRYGYFRYEVPDGERISEEAVPALTLQSGTATEKTVLNKELSRALEFSLQQIPLSYRCVFILREVEGFSVAETAELLEISTVNVKVRLNRAKTLLQKQLEQLYTSSELYEFNLVYCDVVVHKVFERINRSFQ
ncbi:MAG TPA: sigma-70 family RNA polymerase sigma factor [Chitinophagaceae bacterium]